MTNNIIKILSKDRKYYHLINLDDDWKIVKDKLNACVLYGSYDDGYRRETIEFKLSEVFCNCKTLTDIKLVADICQPASIEDIRIFNFNSERYN